MKDRSLQLRRPNADNPRPYDRELVPSIDVEASRPGLSWKGYEGIFPWVPKFWNKNPDQLGTATELNVSLGPDEGAVMFSGYIEVPEDGEYAFYLNSNTKAVARIHEALLIDADFGYERSEIGAKIRLEKGRHPIAIHLLKSGESGPTLEVGWSGPSFKRKALSAESLVH